MDGVIFEKFIGSFKNLKTKIIYGCKSLANFNESFHEKYKSYSINSNAEVFYKRSYNHSKIYCWHDKGVVREIIAGSANFSNNGLRNDFEEILFEVDAKDYNDVYQYLEDALNDSESCLTYNYQKQHISKTSQNKQTSKISFDKIEIISRKSSKTINLNEIHKLPISLKRKIKNKKVLLNDNIESRPYLVVQEKDIISLNKPIEKKVNLILFHKPKGCITSRSDEKNRTIIYDYLPKKFNH